ncbi:NADH-quinone oxidoreductase subunit NuoE [Blastococcus saxobsidens]|uniref:NADH:ubiquinone oxidoreductase, chain E n=1 Tax=Blastococcus saxobsidens (strain DD2) TaxID=1146883 RepID=H6RPJ5_BLASD|nr:NADH-quinone oxidoreductase subunit NuoE [Blastococcus saxobsidens]CCG05254.1 NADH:ubiquinone oxidoreductase, chain E [Blastococcus saxobsidens DD2]
MSFPGSPEGAATTGLDSSPFEGRPEVLDALPPLTEQTRAEAREVMARYPQPRSALLPMLHLVQSYQGFVSPQGLAFCAEELGLTTAEVAAVATFYTMYKRRQTGRHLVSVCTNTLCAVLGGQRIFDALKADLGVGHDETAADGSVTLEHAECLAACDYAPVVTVDYEFYDQQNVDSARELVAALRRGEKPLPTRGAPLTDFKGVSRQLAGFSQHADAVAAAAAVDAPGSYEPSLRGVRLAAERGESAPPMRGPEPEPADTGEPRETVRPSGTTGETPGKEAADARVAAADTPAEKAGAAGSHPDAAEPAGRRLPDGREGTDTPAGQEPGTTGQGPGGRPPAPQGPDGPSRTIEGRGPQRRR